MIRLEPGTLRAPAEVELTAALTNLPDAPAAVFVGRESTLMRLDCELSRDRAQVVISQVIHGLGGIGKTELARQYTIANRDRYRLRWWITAESAEQIQAGLTALTERLHPPAALALTGEQTADWARGWLQTHEGWLLVLDNVEDPAHVRDLLAQFHAGHILVTTRRLVRWPTGVQPIRLEVLDTRAAAELITMLSEQDRPGDWPAVEAIAAELGYLPLALEQAAAYMRESQISPTEYLALLTAHPAHMYAASPEGGDIERTIARLWRVHLDVIGKRNAYAVQLLRVLACYAPDGIPRDILGGDSDRPTVLDALRLLHSYSLITLTEDTVSVHRLIQAVVAAEDESRASLEGDSAPELALTWLADAWAASAELSSSEQRMRRRTLSPHVEGLTHHYPISTESMGNVQIFRQVASYEHGEGSYHRAYKLGSHALAVYRATLGEEHPSTVSTRSNLALVLGDLGCLEEAEDEVRAVLEIFYRALGEEHPSTLPSRSNLASVLWRMGRLEEAERENRAVYMVMARTLGEEHPDTLNSRGNLVTVLGDLGRFEEAEREGRAVWEMRRRVLGEEHPKTLISRDNFAITLRCLGRFEEAERESRAVYMAMARIFGEEHPTSLISRGNFATVLGDLGRFEEAEREGRAVWEIRRRVLGEEHPDTLISHNNLASTLWSLERFEEAERESRAVYVAMARIFGEGHPDTLISRGNLAAALTDLDRFEEAEREGRAVWEIRRRVLGEEHPATLTSRDNLASLLWRMGRLEEAERENRAVYMAMARIFGEEHPDTLTSRGNLVAVLGDLGRFEEAEREGRNVWEIRRRTLGEEHPSALRTLDLIQWVKKQRGCTLDVKVRDGLGSLGRNAPCFCGSGKKLKRCHGVV
ncbi:tetratricopeptide repeat protein [Nonomuraea sp. NPDC004186]